MSYITWPCDNGTVDICDADGVVYQNVEASLAHAFVRSENQRLDLERALGILKQSGLFDGLFDKRT